MIEIEIAAPRAELDKARTWVKSQLKKLGFDQYGHKEWRNGTVCIINGEEVIRLTVGLSVNLIVHRHGEHKGKVVLSAYGIVSGDGPARSTSDGPIDSERGFGPEPIVLGPETDFGPDDLKLLKGAFPKLVNTAMDAFTKEITELMAKCKPHPSGLALRDGFDLNIYDRINRVLYWARVNEKYLTFKEICDFAGNQVYDKKTCQRLLKQMLKLGHLEKKPRVEAYMLVKEKLPKGLNKDFYLNTEKPIV